MVVGNQLGSVTEVKSVLVTRLTSVATEVIVSVVLVEPEVPI